MDSFIAKNEITRMNEDQDMDTENSSMRYSQTTPRVRTTLLAGYFEIVN